MATKEHIERSVNHEFETDYQRQLVKAYLFKALLINPISRDPLTNHEIGKMLGIDRMKVGDYLYHMKVYNSKDVNSNSMFNESFTPKFQAVKRSCEAHARRQMVRFGEDAVKRSDVHLKTAAMNINYNLN